MANKKFQMGDRFQRTGGDKVWGKQEERDFTRGVISGTPNDRSNGAGGCECDLQSCQIYKVRFDGYDYKLESWPTNCHTVAECLLNHEVTEQDIEDALASIKSAIH